MTFTFKNNIYSIITAVSLLAFSGCAGTYKTKVDFNPSENLRVAVLPFIAKDSDGKIINQEGRLLLDNISLISSEVLLSPAQIVRKETIDELKKTSLDIISSALIDIDLPHHGYAKADGSLDIERVLATPVADLCLKYLSCDAVLYGIVTRWDRAYYGIESVNTVGIDLTLVSAKTGAVLFSSKAEDSTSRGISKIPTGLSSVVLEPLKGLDSEIISDLSKSIVAKMLAPLSSSNRPEFINSSPPAIFASSHDGSSKKLSQNNPLIVVAYASENSKASFSIGSTVLEVPMLEISPQHYYGEYIPLATDSFSEQKVVVSVKDSFGRETRSESPGGLISYP